MNSKIRIAIVTTLYFLPALLCQQTFIAMYLQDNRHPNYLEPLTFFIFICMLIITFAIALKSERINKNRIHVFSVISLTIGIVLVFDKNVYAQITFFLLYNYAFIYPFKSFVNNFLNKEKLFEVWMDDSEDMYGKNRYVDSDDELNYFVESFFTLEEATKFIENKIDVMLREMASLSKDIIELKEMDPIHQVSYFIQEKNKEKVFFATYDYIQENAKDIYKASKLQTHADLLKRGNLPDDTRIVPLWLKLKNKQYEIVDISLNSVEDILCLNDSEFKEFLFETSNQRVVFLFLSSLNNIDLNKFYSYIEKLKDGASVDFKENIEIFRNQDLAHKLIVDATIRTKLYVREAKRSFMLNVGTYNEMQMSLFDAHSKKITEYEHKFDLIILGDIEQIPNDFRVHLLKLKIMYSNNEIDDDFCRHIANKYAYLMMSLNALVIDVKDDDFEWFLYAFVDKTNKIAKDDTVINEMTKELTRFFHALAKANFEEYLQSYIKILTIQMRLYPLYKIHTLANIEDVMKFVGEKEINIDNANAFLQFFEDLPAVYEDISYENLIDLKEVINKSIVKYKPLDNKIFDEDSVKNKLILLNYLVDMEDLYYAK